MLPNGASLEVGALGIELHRREVGVAHRAERRREAARGSSSSARRRSRAPRARSRRARSAARGRGTRARGRSPTGRAARGCARRHRPPPRATASPSRASPCGSAASRPSHTPDRCNRSPTGRFLRHHRPCEDAARASQPPRRPRPSRRRAAAGRGRLQRRRVGRCDLVERCARGNAAGHHDGRRRHHAAGCAGDVPGPARHEPTRRARRRPRHPPRARRRRRYGGGQGRGRCARFAPVPPGRSRRLHRALVRSVAAGLEVGGGRRPRRPPAGELLRRPTPHRPRLRLHRDARRHDAVGQRGAAGADRQGPLPDRRRVLRLLTE